MKTKQEVLDIIGDKLMRQGERCGNDVSCFYTDAKGRHCALGWCLPPKLQEALGEYDILGPEELMERYGPEKTGLNPEHLEFYEVVQDIHDNLPVEEWNAGYKMLADQHGLKWNPVGLEDK